MNSTYGDMEALDKVLGIGNQDGGRQQRNLKKFTNYMEDWETGDNVVRKKDNSGVLLVN